MALGVGLLFLGCGFLLAAGDTKDDAVKKDRKKYEGSWQVVSLEVDGNKTNEEDALKITVINEADGMWRIEAEGKVVARGTSEIDPTKKPKTMDSISTGPDKGKKTLAIYELTGDTLKVCVTVGATRPTTFTPKPGSGFGLSVYKPEKK